ncbi:MAG: amidohydrolase family protein [Burkholderiaceae bacterium]
MTALLIRSGRVLDVQTLRYLPDTSLLIRDGRIEAMGPQLPLPEGATVIDARGKTVMPGLIDCHVHVVASRLNLGEVQRMPNVLATLASLPILQGMLMRGFTTVRDAGGADAAIAEATRTDMIRGPRIFPSGKALSQTGGHGDFRMRTDILEPCACSQKVGSLARVVDGVDAVRAAIREELLRGATQIKIMASGGVASPSDPIHYLGFSADEIRAAVEEASNAGTYVLAHAYTARAIRRAVELGVRTIEHGNLVDEDAARVMAEHGAFMVPTLITYEALANEGAKYGLPQASVDKIESVRGAGLKALETLARAGVRMGLGSDLLGESHRLQSDELRIRAQVLGAGATLQQATLIGAEILGQGGQLGVLKAGALADVLVVDGDPLADIGCLLGQGDRIEAIIKDGKRYK